MGEAMAANTMPTHCAILSVSGLFFIRFLAHHRPSVISLANYAEWFVLMDFIAELLNHLNILSSKLAARRASANRSALPQ